VVKGTHLQADGIVVGASGSKIRIPVIDTQRCTYGKIGGDEVGQVGGEFHDLQFGVEVLINGISFLVVRPHS